MSSPIRAKFVVSISTAILSMATFTLASPLNAQSTQLKVNIPFSFESSSDHYAPGVYTINQSKLTPILRIEGQNASGFQSGFQMTLPDRTRNPSDTSKVVFTRYGSRYILKEVWFAGSTSHVHTPKSRVEKELQMAQSPNSNQGYLSLLATPR